MRHAILTLAALLLAPLASTPAADFHVAPSGNDANPGTQPAPFRTTDQIFYQSYPQVR